MPLVVIDGVVVDPMRRAEALAAVCATHDHDFRARGEASWLHTCEQVDIVVCAPAGTVHRHVHLADDSERIDDPAGSDLAAQVNERGAIERRDDRGIFGVARTHTPDLVRVQVDSADEKIAVGIDVEHAPRGRVRDVNRIEPAQAAIGGAAELTTAIIVPSHAPCLILESVAAAVGVVDREPLFIAAGGGTEFQPGLPPVDRAPHVVKEGLE